MAEGQEVNTGCESCASAHGGATHVSGQCCDSTPLPQTVWSLKLNNLKQGHFPVGQKEKEILSAALAAASALWFSVLPCPGWGSGFFRVLLMEFEQCAFTSLQGFFRFPSFLVIVLPFDAVHQAMLIHLLVVYVKDLFELPLVHNVAIIIPLSYPANDVAMLIFIDLCLTRDFFREPEANLGCVKRLVNADVVWEINNNCSSVGS